jgi:hypothetical protein
MFSSHRIRAGILVVVLDTTSRVPLPSMLPFGRAVRSFLVYGTLYILVYCPAYSSTDALAGILNICENIRMYL